MYGCTSMLNIIITSIFCFYLEEFTNLPLVNVNCHLCTVLEVVTTENGISKLTRSKLLPFPHLAKRPRRYSPCFLICISLKYSESWLSSQMTEIFEYTKHSEVSTKGQNSTVFGQSLLSNFHRKELAQGHLQSEWSKSKHKKL